MLDIVAFIVTYNSDLEQLSQAVHSFKNTPLATDIVIVDNASTTDYQTALEEKLGAYATIIHAERNGGFGYGNNLAARHAPDSRYVLLLNPDIVVHEGTLEALIQAMEAASPPIGAATPTTLYPDGTLQPLNKRMPTVLDLFLRRFTPGFATEWGPIKRRLQAYAMLDIGYENPVALDFMTGCFMLIKRDIWNRVGGFDEAFFMYLEDADLTHRINAISSAWYLPVGHITHHWQRGSHRKLKLLLVMLHSIYVYFNKYDWKFW